MLAKSIRLGVLAALLSLPALAQTPDATEVPTRIGNVWNGRKHEPNPAAVQGDSAPRQRQQADELQQLNQQLQSNVQKDPLADTQTPPAR